MDFSRPEEAGQTINSWIEDRTEKKIQDLIAPGVLNAETRLVLTNAIYFKGHWYQRFFTKETADAPFRTTANTEVTVPMMHQTEYFRYSTGDGVQILELPYVNRNASMPNRGSIFTMIGAMKTITSAPGPSTRPALVAV